MFRNTHILYVNEKSKEEIIDHELAHKTHWDKVEKVYNLHFEKKK